MITGISVRNFKSLNDFRLENLAAFSCLIGLNGSGKTTVLQLFDFLGHLAQGTTEMRGWNMTELVTAGSRAKTFPLFVDLLIEGKRLRWSGTYYIEKRRVENEQIRIMEQVSNGNGGRLVEGEELLRIDSNGMLAIQGEADPPKRDLNFLNYQGSLLAHLNINNPLIAAVRDELASLKSFELLNPANLRRPSQEIGELGIGGDGLPGFLSQITSVESARLIESLRVFYPRLQSVDVKRRQFGWKNLLVKEFQRTVQAGHINDGLLRVLAILSQRYTSKTFLFFDEIENGINQEVIQKLVNLLQDFYGKQVMVTTHSALVLNYLSDSVAKDGVVLLYQDERGHTHARKYFEIPEIAERLEFMGPGQVMSQTDLVELASRLCLDSGNRSKTEA